MSAVAVPEIGPMPFDLTGPLQLVEVLGDAMKPTLRGWYDFVMIAPVTRFLYDELYVLRDEDNPLRQSL